MTLVLSDARVAPAYRGRSTQKPTLVGRSTRADDSWRDVEYGTGQGDGALFFSNARLVT